jgi:phosphoglycerate dehydrogenase-like enzyme
MTAIAILDDYQGAARTLADWSALERDCTIETFRTNLAVPDEAARALAPFDILCTMRERQAFPRALIERLPKLKLITVTGPHLRALDMAAATERGIVVSHSTLRGPGGAATPELTWGLILAVARHIPLEDRRLRAGGAWQTTIGMGLEGKTLGLVGLGRVGATVAKIAQGFGMGLIAWSQNLTAERAAAAGARLVDKDTLLREADVVSLHVVLSERTRGLIGTRELALMKPGAILINTSRGPVVDTAALVAALRSGRLRGAGVDVFDEEPLPLDHPLRRLDNAVITPHLGYVAEDVLRIWYEDTVEAIRAFLAGAPIRLLNPEVLGRH